jgi:hypothetical protein
MDERREETLTRTIGATTPLGGLVLSRCLSPLGAAFGDELLLVTGSGHHRPAKTSLKFMSLAADQIKAFDDLRYFSRGERHTVGIVPFRVFGPLMSLVVQ